jgi:hypothetical protein
MGISKIVPDGSELVLVIDIGSAVEGIFNQAKGVGRIKPVFCGSRVTDSRFIAETEIFVELDLSV